MLPLAQLFQHRPARSRGTRRFRGPRGLSPCGLPRHGGTCRDRLRPPAPSPPQLLEGVRATARGRHRGAPDQRALTARTATVPAGPPVLDDVRAVQDDMAVRAQRAGDRRTGLGARPGRGGQGPAAGPAAADSGSAPGAEPGSRTARTMMPLTCVPPPAPPPSRTPGAGWTSAATNPPPGTTAAKSPSQDQPDSTSYDRSAGLIRSRSTWTAGPGADFTTDPGSRGPAAKARTTCPTGKTTFCPWPASGSAQTGTGAPPPERAAPDRTRAVSRWSPRW